MMMNKLAVDVLSTRQHWHAEWVLLVGSPRKLVRRSSFLPRKNGADVATAAQSFDSLIDSGAAVPIARNKQFVCDAMPLIHDQYPYLERMFLGLLETEPLGWEKFLEVAAKYFIACYCDSSGSIEEPILKMWKVWLQYRLPCKVRLYRSWFFFTALVETEQFVARAAQKARAFSE